MVNTGNKVYNQWMNSANRAKSENFYKFSIHFDNENVFMNTNERINVKVVLFSMFNSIYNVKVYTSNIK